MKSNMWMDGASKPQNLLGTTVQGLCGKDEGMLSARSRAHFIFRTADLAIGPTLRLTPRAWLIPNPTLLSLSRFSDSFLGVTGQNSIHKDVCSRVPGYARCNFGVWRIKINFLQECYAKECVISKYYEEFYEHYWLGKSLWGEHNDISWMGN